MINLVSASRIGIEKRHQDRLEEAQSILAAICLDLDEATLRMIQAIRRTSLASDVLHPAVEKLELARGEISRAQGNLNISWKEGQRKKWRKDEHSHR